MDYKSRSLLGYIWLTNSHQLALMQYPSLGCMHEAGLQLS